MVDRTFSEEQVMLAFALLSYRGFYRLDSDGDDELTASLTDGLSAYEGIIGPWELVWGPGRYRFIGEAFDDSLMFLARHKEDHHRFTVIIRGTNPVALRDWLFFDFLATRQIGWAPAGVKRDGEAKLSLSTGLGLGTLLGMRAPVDMSLFEEGDISFSIDFLERLFPMGSRLVRGAQEATAQAFLKGLKVIRSVARDLQRATSSRGVGAAIEAYRGVLEVLDPLILAVEDVALDVLVTVLSWEIDRDHGDQSQPRLIDVFGAITRSADAPIEITVTGHSKGGALAPALALYLADTQGSGDIPEEDRWDPGHRARIRCFPFAGPTAGNGAFVRRYDDMIGSNGSRVTNELDIVTHAWIPESIAEVPKLYGPGLPAPKVLALLAHELAKDVKELGYHHIDTNVETFRGELYDTGRSFLAQVVRQHLHAYIDHLDLHDQIDPIDLVGALPNV